MLQKTCPCGSGTPYDGCCDRLHRGAAQAGTAEELMRSRYAAYAVTTRSEEKPWTAFESERFPTIVLLEDL